MKTTANENALRLIERLHFISANIKNSSDRIKIDLFVLALTKYVKENAPVSMAE